MGPGGMDEALLIVALAGALIAACLAVASPRAALSVGVAEDAAKDTPTAAAPSSRS